MNSQLILGWTSMRCLLAEKQRGRMFSVDEFVCSLDNVQRLYSLVLSALLCLFCRKKQPSWTATEVSGSLKNPLVFIHSAVLFHLCFLLWCWVFKNPAMFQSLFSMIDSFVGQAQYCFTTEKSNSFSIRPDGFGKGCRGRPDCCWLTAFMTMIEHESLK